jgi:protein TonB
MRSVALLVLAIVPLALPFTACGGAAQVQCAPCPEPSCPPRATATPTTTTTPTTTPTTAVTGPYTPKVLPKVTPAAARAGDAWDCVFPLEAKNIEIAEVSVRVLVTPDGRPIQVDVLADPGSGFGEAARACALKHTYEPAREDGRAVRGYTTPFNIRFAR